MNKGSLFALLLLLVVGLYLRLHYVLQAQYPPLDWDQLEYTKTAIQLLNKGIYAYRDTMPNSLVTPGWPLMLAGVFCIIGYEPLEPALMVIRLLNCFIALGAITFIFLLGRRLFHPITGFLAAGFATVYPSYVWSTSLILTEVPFLTAFTGMLYLQVRIIQENKGKDHLWMGLLLGICVLFRPNALPMAIIPYVFLWTKDKQINWKPTLLAAASFAFVMLPWWIRNLLTFHEFIFIAKGEAGNPFLGGTDPYFADTIDWNHINKDHQFAEGLKRIRQGLKDNPWLWIKWMTVGKLFVFFKTMWVGPYPFSVPAWYANLLVKLHNYLITFGAFSLMAFSLRNRSIRYLTCSFFVFLSVHLVFIPVDRYLYGMLPFLMLGTAYFVTQALFLIRYVWITSLLQRKGI
ncbi:glycosyltransferase family 39 protein [Paenibacillus sp. SYP-B3998]|uniref:Glycosyltransferase family 39 protein n=1 Tax=Paenibacillus sp. SYP-B3998 TaxID=2678564 RepID=A0A6G3ZTK1_9BACL|nr:glycosyltransferase family 39 protein [Paenibacillus sp. SYP-B3998]NEW05368.1 glycosyltransferase family 39 protein [Paenibacillus sp. SYP-B3998]